MGSVVLTWSYRRPVGQPCKLFPLSASQASEVLLGASSAGRCLRDGWKPPNPEVVGARFEGLKAKLCLDVELDAKLDAGETAARVGAAAKSVLIDGESDCNGDVEKESSSPLASMSGETAAEVAMMYWRGLEACEIR